MFVYNNTTNLKSLILVSTGEDQDGSSVASSDYGPSTEADFSSLEKFKMHGKSLKTEYQMRINYLKRKYTKKNKKEKKKESVLGWVKGKVCKGKFVCFFGWN